MYAHSECTNVHTFTCLIKFQINTGCPEIVITHNVKVRNGMSLLVYACARINFYVMKAA